MNDSDVFKNWGEFDFLPDSTRERYIAIHAYRLGIASAYAEINKKCNHVLKQHDEKKQMPNA